MDSITLLVAIPKTALWGRTEYLIDNLSPRKRDDRSNVFSSIIPTSVPYTEEDIDRWLYHILSHGTGAYLLNPDFTYVKKVYYLI